MFIETCSIWDPKILLDYFTKTDCNEKLIFQELASKLITLLALITGQHMQTFANIKKDNIDVRDKKLEIQIPDRIKRTGVNRNLPILVLPVYPKNKKICPATAFVYHKEEALFTITIELH